MSGQKRIGYYYTHHKGPPIHILAPFGWGPLGGEGGGQPKTKFSRMFLLRPNLTKVIWEESP